ncbi:MAG: hypothetical protein Q9170_007348 [Blastenia crenularia]
MTPVLYIDRDRTWNLRKIQIWAVLEVNVGLVCAYALAFPAFINRYKTPFTHRLRSYTSFLRPTTFHLATLSNNERSGSSVLRAPVGNFYDGYHKKNGSYLELSRDKDGHLLTEVAVAGKSPHGRKHKVRIADKDY